MSTYQFQQRCISSWTDEFLFCSDETWTFLLMTGADDPSRNVGYPYVASILLKLHSGKAIFVHWVNLIHPKVRNSTVFILPGTRNVQNYKIIFITCSHSPCFHNIRAKIRQVPRDIRPRYFWTVAVSKECGVS